MSYQVPIGPANTSQRIKSVRDYALSKYNKGWDVVVDSTTDEEILVVIRGTTTCWGAIDKMSAQVKALLACRKGNSQEAA